MNTEKLLSELPFLKTRKSADGIDAFDCPPQHLERTAKTLHDRFEFQSLNDIAAIDMGEDAGDARFGAVYHFFSHSKKVYVRLVCMCESAAEPKLPSLCPVYKGADWHEREAFDMMGIVFEGHPSLRRILMWDGYPWHPLRKDFPLAGRDAPLPPSFDGEETTVRVMAASEEGGPFHSPSDGSAQFSTEKEPRSFAETSKKCGPADSKGS